MATDQKLSATMSAYLALMLHIMAASDHASKALLRLAYGCLRPEMSYLAVIFPMHWYDQYAKCCFPHMRDVHMLAYAYTCGLTQGGTANTANVSLGCTSSKCAFPKGEH